MRATIFFPIYWLIINVLRHVPRRPCLTLRDENFIVSGTRWFLPQTLVEFILNSTGWNNFEIHVLALVLKITLHGHWNPLMRHSLAADILTSVGDLYSAKYFVVKGCEWSKSRLSVWVFVFQCGFLKITDNHTGHGDCFQYFFISNSLNFSTCACSC